MPEPIILLQSEETANDSDKTVSASSGKTWEVLSLRVEFTAIAATTSARTRNFSKIDFRDTDDDVFLSVPVQNNAVVGGEAMIFNFYVGAATRAPVDASTEGTQELPDNLFLPLDGDIRVNITNAATTDDMIVHTLVREHG